MNRIEEMEKFVGELYYIKHDLLEAMQQSLSFKFLLDGYKDEIREKAVEIVKEKKGIDNINFFKDEDWGLVEEEEYLLFEKRKAGYNRDKIYDAHEFLYINFDIKRIESILLFIQERIEKLKNAEINTFLIEVDIRDLLDYIEKLRLKLLLIEVDYDSKEIEEFNNFIESDYVWHFDMDFNSGMVSITYNYNDLEKIFRSLENYSHRVVYDLENE